MKKRKKKIELFDVVNTLLVALITLSILYPLYFCVIASFSKPETVIKGETLLWIKDFTLESYRHVFKESSLWIGYKNTIIYTVLGTLYNLVMTIPLAYALSKKDLPFRGTISWYFFITMYFGGGMIASYFLIKSLGLYDNPLVMIIGTGVSCSNLIITRQYFTSSIPSDLYEAAYIDGANEWQSFKDIALPLAKPIIAVMTLYYGVGKWNSYFSALLYLRSDEYKPLQLVLREILINNKIGVDMSGLDVSELAHAVERANIVEGMKYAIVFIASAPLLIIYPFLQKYFAKGIMVGSVKG